MSRAITVVTPENIRVTYPVAGFASRFMATLADLAIQFTLLLLVGAILGKAIGLGRHSGLSMATLLSAAEIIIAYLILFAYATFFEMLWGGRTPGKRLFGLRVIREGGYPINLVSSVAASGPGAGAAWGAFSGPAALPVPAESRTTPNR